MVIIYPNDPANANTSTITVLRPLEPTMTIQQIAKKDVPAGVPYLIVQDSDVPTDRTYRAAWTADFSAPDGHGGAP